MNEQTTARAAENLYKALNGIYIEELNGRLCAMPETLPDPWSDDPQVPRESKCCPSCRRHWERTAEALREYEALLIGATPARASVRPKETR